jgi:drug/metabolite transporter (DMT)-like permease
VSDTAIASSTDHGGSARLQPWLALAGVYILWGTTYLAIRVAVAGEPPFAVAAFRYLSAGVLLLLLTARDRKAPRLDLRTCARATVVASLLLVGGNGLLSLGERDVQAGAAALLVATVPLWLVLLEGLRMRALPRARVAAALPIGILGVGVLVGAGATGVPTVGAAIVLAAAVCWAFGSLAARQLALPASLRLSGMEMLAGGLMLALVSGSAGEWSRLSLHALRWQEIFALFWLVLPGSVVAFSAYGYALRNLPIATVGTYAYVNPVVAIGSAAVVLGEPIGLRTVVATALVVTSVGLTVGAGRSAQPRRSRRQTGTDG